MPTRRDGLAATAVDRVVYATGGQSATNAYETAVKAYTPVLHVYIMD